MRIVTFSSRLLREMKNKLSRVREEFAIMWRNGAGQGIINCVRGGKVVIPVLN